MLSALDVHWTVAQPQEKDGSIFNHLVQCFRNRCYRSSQDIDPLSPQQQPGLFIPICQTHIVMCAIMWFYLLNTLPKRFHLLSWFHYHQHHDRSGPSVPRPTPWWQLENGPWIFPLLSLPHTNHCQICLLLVLLSTAPQTALPLARIILETPCLVSLRFCDS